MSATVPLPVTVTVPVAAELRLGAGCGLKTQKFKVDASHWHASLSATVDWTRLYRACGLRRTEEYRRADPDQLQIRKNPRLGALTSAKSGYVYH